MAHFDSLEQEAFLNLWRTYDRLKMLEEELFAEFDLTAQQYNALRLLRSVFPQSMSVSELGRRLVSRAPDMTRLLDRLEQRGLVRRDRGGQDRRTVWLTITDAGIDLLRQISVPLAECHRRQLGHMSPTSLRRLITLLYQARAPHEDEEFWLPGTRTKRTAASKMPATKRRVAKKSAALSEGT